MSNKVESISYSPQKGSGGIIRIVCNQSHGEHLIGTKYCDEVLISWKCTTKFQEKMKVVALQSTSGKPSYLVVEEFDEINIIEAMIYISQNLV